MPGYIEDRWLTKRPDPDTGERRKTARYGQGKRYRVAGVPGVRGRSFDKLTDAKAWKSKAEHEAAQGEFVDPRLGQITLREYIEAHWWPTRAADDPGTRSTVRSRINHIVDLLGSRQLVHVRVPQLRTFLTQLQGRLGPSTVHDVWGTLSSIMQAAIDDERIRRNPCKAKTITLPKIPPKKVQPWTRPRIRAVRAALPDRFRVMVDVGVGVGLRQGEVLGLAKGDIDAAACVIHVRRQVKKVGAQLVFALPKGGKTRAVPAPPHLIRQLQAHMASCPPVSVTLPWGNPTAPATEKEARERAPRTFELVFTTTAGGAIRRDSWNRAYWKPALAAAGVIPAPKPVQQGKRTVLKYAQAREEGFHVLRHTFASVQLDARETIVSVSKWLGHADPSITLRIYAHMMPEADGRGRAAMEAWFAADGEAFSPDTPQSPVGPAMEGGEGLTEGFTINAPRTPLPATANA